MPYDAAEEQEDNYMGEEVCIHCRSTKVNHGPDSRCMIPGTTKTEPFFYEVAKKETINHPDHYGGEENPYEAIRVIEAWQLGFCLGNTVKYICRAGKKDKKTELEDLQKAKWYLDRRIQQLEDFT